MNFTDYQAASEPEESSFPITYKPRWSTIRSASELSSPISELSNLSRNLSEISDLNINTTQSHHPLPTSLYQDPIPTSASTHIPVLFDPSTNLSLPQLTMPTSTSNQNLNYVIPPLAQMPIRGSKNAPTTFRGGFKHVEKFVDHYSRLLDFYHVTSEADKCQGILEYCSQDVKDYIQVHPNYLTPDWNKLKEEILAAYDADRMNTRIRFKDFLKLVKQFRQGHITNLSQWKRYHRDYVTKAGFLKQKDRISDKQYHGYYWFGIPAHLQGIFEIQLRMSNPTFDNSNPWPISSVQDVAEAYFKRTKFSSQLPHLPLFGYDEEDDEEEEDSDDDYEFDSDDSEDYEEERKRRRREKLKKKKKVKKIKREPPTQVIAEPPSRKIVPPPEEKGFEGLIEWLNTMSIEDPQYGTLYYQAVSRDSSGLVAQCIRQKPRQVTVAPIAPQPIRPLSIRPQQVRPQPMQYPPPRDLPPHQYPVSNGPQPYPRGIIPQQPGMQIPSKCFGCAGTDHSLRDCSKMAQLLNQGIVTRDSQTLKYRLPNGQPLYRKPDECLIETINQIKPPAQGIVQFAKISEEVNNFYAKQSGRSFLQYSLSDEEDDGDEYENDYETEYEDDDEYEEAHWKRRLNRNKEFPVYASYEAYDEDDAQERVNVYPAERTDKGKTTRQAREAAMNHPIKKAQLDGVYMPKRSNRSAEKLSEIVSVPLKSTMPVREISKDREAMKSKENVPLPDKEPIPVDVRKPRFNENSDIFMKDLEAQPKQAPEKSITLQDYKNRTKNPDGKKFESSADQTWTGPRQSELSIKVDSNEVIKNILDTPVSISIGNLLGTSRDLAVKVNDMIQYKNPIMPTTQKVYNTQMRQEDSEMEPSMPPIEQSKRIKNFSRMLILIKLYCYGNPIWATVDTGSQINVVSKRIADKHIRLPVDISKQIIISDVNGNSGTVTGMINSAPLRCGNVITEATELYVAENLPCELLLGRPWQRGNLVSIDERPEGTYLVFKDPKTLKPRYEMHIAPEDVVPDTKFRPYMNAKVYTAIDVAEDKSEQLSHQVTIDNQTPIFESIEQFHLTQSDVKDITLEDWSQVKSYTDTELSDHKLFQIPLYNKNALITTIIDTGALVNIVDKRIVERLIREPINPYRTGVVYDQEGVPIKLVGTINNVPLTCGMANIMVDEIYVGKNLPFGLLLGHGWQSKYMPIVEERNTGTYIKIRSQLATGPTEFLTALKPPEVKWSKMSSISNSMELNMTFNRIKKKTKKKKNRRIKY
jgi:hypothetical protein